MRSRGRLAVVLAPSIVLAWSCATDPEPDPRTDIDRAIPELDASWTPSPRPPAVLPDSSLAPPPIVDAAARDAEPAPPAPPTVPMQRALAGEVTITEVMYDPLGEEPASEWIELRNDAASPRSLDGLTLRDGSDRTHTIAGDVVIAPGAYAVLARERDAALASGVPASAIVYVYGAGLSVTQGVLLANGASGAVRLLDGTTELTSCAYGGYRFADASGRSAQLDATTTYDARTWCSAAPTPGAANVCAAR